MKVFKNRFLLKAIELLNKELSSIMWNEDHIQDDILTLEFEIDEIASDEFGEAHYNILVKFSLDLIKKTTYIDSPTEHEFAKKGAAELDVYVGNKDGDELYSDEIEVTVTNETF